MSNTGKTEPLSDDTNKKGSILQLFRETHEISLFFV